MRLEYIDLLSGDSIPIENIGHVRSPKLYEVVKPTIGIGSYKYALYLNLFVWDKEQFLKHAKQTTLTGLKAFDKANKLECFDYMTLLKPVRELLGEAISFFMDEVNVWSDKDRGYITINKNNERIGLIDRNNFKDLASTILQLNYVKLDKKATPNKESTKLAQNRWDEVQKFLEKQQSTKQTKTKEETEYSIANIISKLCCLHNSYNLLNIFDLTIFQLYDQFSQVSYLRVSDMNDRIFSIHGGEKYKPDEWLKPINKKIKE